MASSATCIHVRICGESVYVRGLDGLLPNRLRAAEGAYKAKLRVRLKVKEHQAWLH